jgi:hypothetical protein
VSVSIDLRDAGAVADLFERAADAMRADPKRHGCAVRLPAAGRLLATGDLHDNLDNLRTITKLARLGESADHHVVLHEMIHGEMLINGMDFSYRMLARVAELVLQYQGSAGGQVHPLLANHELAQLTGKGISKGAGNSVELFDEALDFVFGDACEEVAGAIRGFIRAMPLALVSEGHEGGVLCAHSLPDARTAARFDPAVLERELVEDDYAAPLGAAYMMVWGREFTDEQIANLAQQWGVKLFCLGHRHVETGIEMIRQRVIVLNSDHERATALPLDLSEVPCAEDAVMHGVPLSAVR